MTTTIVASRLERVRSSKAKAAKTTKFILEGIGAVIFMASLISLAFGFVLEFLIPLAIVACLFIPKQFKWGKISLLTILTYCWVSQLAGLYLVHHQVMEFNTVLGTTPPVAYATGQRDPDEKSVIKLDFGGKLTPILKQRDEVLKSHGFKSYGSWKTSTTNTSYAMFYFYWPFS